MEGSDRGLSPGFCASTSGPCRPIPERARSKGTGVQMLELAWWWAIASARRASGRHRDQRGAALVEYALLVAFIAILCVGVILFLGNSLADKFSSVQSGVSP
jgi:pilus assembly protein Flp/PilA